MSRAHLLYLWRHDRGALLIPVLLPAAVWLAGMLSEIL
jgi:hypothetical protein